MKRAAKAYGSALLQEYGDIERVRISSKVVDIKSKKSGIIKSIDALEIGKLSVLLGAGRENKEDIINLEVGIKLEKSLMMV